MKTYKFTFNLVILSLISIIVFLVLLPIMGDIFILKPKYLTIMILWLILHELIHYIGFLASKGIKPKDLVLGISLEKGIMYCMCKKEISKKGILFSLLLPFTLIGIITLFIGLKINSELLVFLSILNISSAVGDLGMALFFLVLPNDIQYIDKESETSFYLKSKKDLTKYSNCIIKNIKNDNPKDNPKKIRITKISYIILIITIVLSLL